MRAKLLLIGYTAYINCFEGLQVQKPDGSWLSVKTDRSLGMHFES